MTEEHECSCRGANPNCFKCGGWGWIGDKIYEDRGDLTDLANDVSKPKLIVRCPHCGARVSLRRINRHLRKIHHVTVPLFSEATT